MRGAKLTARELAPDETSEIRDRLTLLAGDGRRTEATSLLNDTQVRPRYYDQTKFDRAHQTINKYFASLSASSTVGLILLLQLEEILIPLLKTGRSRTVHDLWVRYTATAKYIKACYETNFFEPNSEGWKYLMMVRSMHQRAHKLLNSSECSSLAKPKDGRHVDGYVWVNQYDMAMTQFAFIGLFILRPDKCGAHSINESELSEIVYYWQLISYQLGIEERFNLFVYSHDMSKQKHLLEMVLAEYKRKLAKPRISTGVAMGRGVLLAFEDLSTEVTWNIVEHHWFSVVSLSGSEQPEPYDGLGERWKLARFQLIFKCLLKSELMQKYLNQMYKRKFEKFCAKGEKFKKKLTKKYPNHIYELTDVELDAVS